MLELDSVSFADHDARISTCRSRHKLLNDLHEFVFRQFAFDPPTAYPAELDPFVEKELSGISPDYSLILLSSPEHSYSILSVPPLYPTFVETLDPYVPETLHLDELDKKWLVVISFPSMDARNVLGHVALVGHELMHFRDRVVKISDSLISENVVSVIKSRLVELINEQIRTLQARLYPADLRSEMVLQSHRFWVDTLRAEAVNEAGNLLRNWLREIVADLLAVHLYGPAAFLTLGRVAISKGDLWKSSLTHPDPSLRLLLMHDELRFLGYSPRHRALDRERRRQLSSIVSELTSWVNAASSPAKSDDDIKSVVRRSIWRSRGAIKAKIRDIVSCRSYSAANYVKEVPELASSLAFGVPPAEILDPSKDIPVPASLAGILNAAQEVWLFRRHELSKQLGFSTSESDCMDVLNRLVLKGIEALTFYDAERLEAAS